MKATMVASLLLKHAGSADCAEVLYGRMGSAEVKAYLIRRYDHPSNMIAHERLFLSYLTESQSVVDA